MVVCVGVCVCVCVPPCSIERVDGWLVEAGLAVRGGACYRVVVLEFALTFWERVLLRRWGRCGCRMRCRGRSPAGQVVVVPLAVVGVWPTLAASDLPQYGDTSCNSR